MYTDEMLRLRKQRHVSSCGLACVSMIADKAYDTVVDDFDSIAEDWGKSVKWGYMYARKAYGWLYFTNTHDLHYMLDHYGIRSHKRWSLYRGRDSLPKVSILAVNKSPFGGWHWVVAEKLRSHVRILDPWNGERTLNDYRGKVYSSIKIC